MKFIPEKQEAQEVPFFKNAKAADGWAGHTTGKTLKKLISEIEAVLSLLDGKIIKFNKGTYPGKNPRDGYHIHYVMVVDEEINKGIIEIAALPIEKPNWMSIQKEKTYKKQREQSLRMALFMVRDALKGMWYLQQLSPGLIALLPFMEIDNTGKNLSRLWGERSKLKQLLPPSGDGEFELETVEGEFTEA